MSTVQKRSHKRNRQFLLQVQFLLMPVLLALAFPAQAGARKEQAAEIRGQLIQKILPYWYDTAVDRTNGGFILADDGSGSPSVAKTKMLVTQCRMIWTFSHAHIHRLGDGRRDYLLAAKQGFDFLEKHFRDPQNGGYYWTTDLQGTPVNSNKIVYGQSFALYGMVEYFRATGNRQALDRAMELYQFLQRRAHDNTHQGWGEHFTADWTPTRQPGSDAMVEVPGYKSANTHLHLMEAFAELFEQTRDPAVRKSLEEALRINRRYFYPANATESCFHRQPDWSPVKDPSSAGLSYGHNVEFAWLMIRAQQALKQKPDWSHFEAHVNHALKNGYDHERGGVYALGLDDQPAHKTEKVWWVQSEMLAALVTSLEHKESAAHAAALDSLLQFIARHQADPKDGIWFDTVAADGTPKNRAKAHNWKANYHDVRALVMFAEAFSK